MARDMTQRREPVLRASEPPVQRGGEAANRAVEPSLRDLLVTTTPSVEGRPVATYLAIVTGEATVPADALSDAPAPRGFFARFKGSRQPEGRPLADAREKAMRDLKSRAVARGADAVVGVTLATQALGDQVLLTATGTAVKLG